MASIITTVKLSAFILYIYTLYSTRIIITAENIIMLYFSTFVNVYVITLYSVPIAIAIYNMQAFGIFTTRQSCNLIRVRRAAGSV